jgi:hypothetical protein
MLCSFLKAISESALFVLMIEQKQWWTFIVGGPDRVAILEKSHPAKNHDLSRLISNLSQLNCSSERNSVYWLFNGVYSFTTARSTSALPQSYSSSPSSTLSELATTTWVWLTTWTPSRTNSRHHLSQHKTLIRAAPGDQKCVCWV